jgi:hypothetical protein
VLAKYIERGFLHGFGLNPAAAPNPNNKPQDSRIITANHEMHLLHVNPNVFAIMARKLNELHCITPLIAS